MTQPHRSFWSGVRAWWQTATAGRLRARWRALGLRGRLFALAPIVILLSAMTAIIISLLGDGWRWWLAPRFERSYPDDWSAVLLLDFVWMVLIVAGATQVWTTSWTDRLHRPRTFTAFVVLAATFIGSGAIENVLLRRDADRALDSMYDDLARAIDFSTNTQIAALVLMGLLLVFIWTIPIPGVTEVAHDRKGTWATPPKTNVTWGGPGDQPVDADWDPDPNRLGIAVSGGGIRSASFSLGVLQELRQNGVLGRASYVTSVSGGSYTTSALTALNQYGTDANGALDPDAPPPDQPFRPDSEEEQRLRRSLRYLVDSGVWGAIGRILLGLAINLAIAYLVIVIVFRPVGWFIGTPLVQDGLRLDGPVAIDVHGSSDDPDGGAQPFTKCGVTTPAPETTANVGTGITIGSGDDVQQANEVDIAASGFCVELRHPGGESTFAHVEVEQSAPGVIALERGEVSIVRQPRLRLADTFGASRGEPIPEGLAPADVITIAHPKIAIADGATGIAGLNRTEILQPFVEVGRAAAVEVRPTHERRADVEIDVDERHWLPAVIAFAGALAAAVARTVIRPDSYRGLDAITRFLLRVAAGWTALFLVIPWLASRAPGFFADIARGDGSTGANLPDWVPLDPDSVPPFVAIVIVGITSVTRFLTLARPPKQGDVDKPRKAQTRALLSKLVIGVQNIVLFSALFILVAGAAVLELTGGALNGPSGSFPSTTNKLFGVVIDTPLTDLGLWVGACLIALIGLGMGESSGWSPAPIYKRRLSRAFHMQRNALGKIEPRRYGKDTDWYELTPTNHSPRTAADGTPVDDRVGYVDGAHPDGAELVLCMAANIVEPGRVPVGRASVSFTASRSHIGGPEVGWMPTETYRARMGRRRAWDVNLPGLTATSAAAVSAAMGKHAFSSRVGRYLALLNVRLGTWLPHPQWVANLRSETNEPATWEHNPGWPWYLREVLRKHAHDAPYLYVSDGGHWENLALVEALRRGCTTIVCISAAGDGPLSLNTFGEAVEIARTDLGVEIIVDDIWKTRQRLGSPAEALESGREYILEPGPTAELGRAAGAGFTFGSFTYPATDDRDPVEGRLLVIDAAMVDRLPADVHTYAEGHPEFPNVSTGDQLFTDRDFESYRVLGRELTRAAFRDTDGDASDDDARAFRNQVASARRGGPAPRDPVSGDPTSSATSDAPAATTAPRSASTAWATWGRTAEGTEQRWLVVVRRRFNGWRRRPR